MLGSTSAAAEAPIPLIPLQPSAHNQNHIIQRDPQAKISSTLDREDEQCGKKKEENI